MTPPYWPQPHPYAQDFDEFWLVQRLPPFPWPEWQPGLWDLQRYGPPGTRWTFSLADYWDRLNQPGFSLAFQSTLRLLREELQVGGIVAGSHSGWQNPGVLPIPPQEGPVMRWWHVTVVGKLGAVEEVNHTFNFITKPTPDLDQNAAQGSVFAGQVGAAWTAFMNDTSQVNVREVLSHNLKYTQVRAAYLEQTAPAGITTHQGKRGPVKDFHYPRPTYLVPTQYWDFPSGGLQCTGAGNDLPWEVASAFTLTTGLRGSRNRGRTYLGPWPVGAMGADGYFAPTVRQVSNSFGTKFCAGINSASGNRLVVLSRSYATSVPVTGVACGMVPDAQRRRRRSQPELSVPGVQF